MLTKATMRRMRTESVVELSLRSWVEEEDFVNGFVKNDFDLIFLQSSWYRVSVFTVFPFDLGEWFI